MNYYTIMYNDEYFVNPVITVVLDALSKKISEKYYTMYCIDA